MVETELLAITGLTLIIGLIALYFLTGIKKDSRNIMHYQVRMTDLINVKNKILANHPPLEKNPIMVDEQHIEEPPIQPPEPQEIKPQEPTGQEVKENKELAKKIPEDYDNKNIKRAINILLNKL